MHQGMKNALIHITERKKRFITTKLIILLTNFLRSRKFKHRKFKYIYRKFKYI